MPKKKKDKVSKALARGAHLIDVVRSAKGKPKEVARALPSGAIDKSPKTTASVKRRRQMGKASQQAAGQSAFVGKTKKTDIIDPTVRDIKAKRGMGKRAAKIAAAGASRGKKKKKKR